MQQHKLRARSQTRRPFFFPASSRLFRLLSGDRCCRPSKPRLCDDDSAAVVLPESCRRADVSRVRRTLRGAHRCHWICLSRATPTVRAAFAAAALARAYSRETRVSERAGTTRRARAARQQAMLEARRGRRRCCTQWRARLGAWFLISGFPASRRPKMIWWCWCSSCGVQKRQESWGSPSRPSPPTEPRARLAPLDLAAAGERLPTGWLCRLSASPPHFSHHAGEVTLPRLQRDRTTSSPLAAAHRTKSHGRFG